MTEIQSPRRGDDLLGLELWQQALEGKNCDMKITIWGKHTYFEAHYCVFTVFSAKRQNRIELPSSCKVENVRKVLKFIYTGKIDVDETNRENTCFVARLLMIEELEHLLGDKVNAENFMQMLIQDSPETIKQQAFKFFRDNFNKVVSNPENVEKLPLENLRTLVVSDNLNVDSETQVLETVHLWLKANSAKIDKDAIEDLIQLIRFENLNLEEITILSEKNYLMEFPIYKDLLFKALLEQKTRKSTQRPRIRIVANPVVKKEFTIIACDSKSQTFDTEQKKWVNYSDIPAFPEKIYQFCAAKVGDSIYVMGGARAPRQFEGTIRSTFILSLRTKTWHSGPDMRDERQDAGCVIIGEKIYVTGGVQSKRGSELDKCECLDITKETKQWEAIAPMRGRRQQHAAVTHKGKIYVFGLAGKEIQGETMFEMLKQIFDIDHNSAEEYDPMEDSWTKILAIQPIHPGCKAVVFKDKIYIAGGDRENILSYDPKANQWEIFDGPKEDHYIGALFEYNEDLYLVGGMHKNSETWSKTIEKYNPQNDEWTFCPQRLIHCIMGGVQLVS